MCPHVTHAFFGPPESTTQTASEAVQPFPFFGWVGPHLTHSRLGRGYLHTKWHLSPSSRLATTDIHMGRKLGAVRAPSGEE